MAARRQRETWEELVTFLNRGHYASKVEIAQAIARIGNVEAVGTVITRARRNGATIIYSRARGLYTTKPNGMELIGDFMYRFKMIGGFCRNAQGGLDYYAKHKTKLLRGLDKDNGTHIDKLIRAIVALQIKWAQLGKTVL